ncbi:hypothetical protein PM082_014639 [Marasmius tenuissimus]|nr:hypothetical protein PM082_014639 [Marasmius tenuissimus]
MQPQKRSQGFEQTDPAQICLTCGRSFTTVLISSSSVPLDDEMDIDRIYALPMEDATYDGIHRRCQETSEAISFLDAQIHSVTSTLESLRLQNQTLSHRLLGYQSMLIPAQRLPHDVLAHIFTLAIESGSLTSAAEGPYVEWLGSGLATLRAFRRPPWALAQVCRTWRFSILNLPQLWTGFYFNYPEPHPLSPPSHASLTRSHFESLLTQLRHSQSQPIQIVIDDFPDTPLTCDILSVLCTDHIKSRWLDATIVLHSHTPRSLQPFTGAFLNIRTLDLYLARTSLEDKNDVFFDVFHDSPNLRTLSIWGQCGSNNRGLILMLPWKQITRYIARDSAGFYTSNGFHHAILPLLERVEECWLNCILLDEEPEEITLVSRPLVLLHLHTLVLSSATDVRENSGLDELLEQLSLPALQTLKFRNGLPGGSSHSLKDMLERSSCSLRELVLHDIEDWEHLDQDFATILWSGPLKTLHTLTIGSKDSEDRDSCLRILDALTVRSEVEPPLPNLRLFQTNCYQLSWKALYTMVQSRRSVTSRTQNFRHSLIEHLVIQAHSELTKTETNERWVEATQVFRGACIEGLVLESKGAGFFWVFTGRTTTYNMLTSTYQRSIRVYTSPSLQSASKRIVVDKSSN